MSETSVKTVDLATTSMVCPSCSLLIEMALKKKDGVKEVESDYAKQRTEVSFDPAVISLEKIIDTIEELGYHTSQVA